MNKRNTRVFFVAVFILSTIYFLFIKTELYESKTAIIVRDLSAQSSSGGFELSFLGGGSSTQVQDSLVVQEYLLSLDVFLLLDKEFHLTEHYKSDKLDLIGRLHTDAKMEDTLEFYRNRLLITYDEISGILYVAYAHPTPKVSQDILKFLVEHVEKELNEFNRRKARKQLKFILVEHQKHKEQMEASAKTLEAYQNKHLLLDPSANAASSSAIIASLEASLTQKQIALSSLRAYMNESSHEIQALKNEIKGIKSSIVKKKRGLSGKDKSRLNKTLFEYEKLKMALEFETEVYKGSLIQLETTRLDVSKEAKTLSVLSKPNLPDGYTYPNKQKVFITLLIVVLLMYGIFSMLTSIIRDHKE